MTPNTKIDYPTFLNTFPTSNLSYDPTNWKHIAGGIGMGVGALGLVALRILNVQKVNHDPIYSTLIDFGMGTLLQSAAQITLPREHSNHWKSFIADYGTPLFLTITQIYLNVQYAPVREGALGFLSGLGGMATSAFIHTLVTRRLSEVYMEIPMHEGNSELSKPTLTCYFPTRYTTRISWSLIKTGLGIGGLIANQYISKAYLIRDFSLIVLGSGMGSLLNEGWIQRSRKTSPELDPKEYKIHQIGMRIFHFVAYTTPGVLFPLAEEIGSRGFTSIGGTLFFFIGLFDAMRRHLEQVRFSETPYDMLHELKVPEQDLSKFEIVFKGSKWVYASLFVNAYLTLSAIGFNPETRSLDPISPFIPIAITTFGLSLWGSYALGYAAKKKFDPEANSKVWNTLYFISQYSIGIPLIALYIFEKMHIGDVTLKKDKVLKGIASTVAYASFGLNIGFEAQNRGTFYEPRVLSPLGFALLGRLVANRMRGQI